MRQAPGTPAAIILIAALGAMCYANTLHYPFVFDDNAFIKNNPAIHNIYDLGSIWRYNAARFVTLLTFSLNHHFGGVDTFGYHLVNIAIHLANSFLVLWLVSLIVTSGVEESWISAKQAGFFKWVPVLSAAVFTVHPIQTQAVTYIWQRNASLSAMFYLLAMALYMRSARTNEDMARRVLYIGALISALAAMFTKQISVTLPLAIAMLDLYFIRGSAKEFKPAFARLFPFFLLAPIIPAITAMGLTREAFDLEMRAGRILPHAEYFLTQLNVIVTYLRLLILPVNQNLDYDYPVAHSIADVWLSVVALSTLLLIAAFLFRKNRIVSFGILFFFLALSVESSFLPLEDVIFEHRLYLASAGMIMAFWAGLADVTGRFERPAFNSATGWVVLALVATPLSIATVNRNTVWKDPETLWTDVINKSPGKGRGYNDLAIIRLEERRLDEAEALLKRGIAVDPEYPNLHSNLGYLYSQKGMVEEALAEHEIAVKADPSMPMGPFLMGNGFMRDREYAKAALCFRSAVRLKPNSLALRVKLADALIADGRHGEAVKVYEDYLISHPANMNAKARLESLAHDMEQK